MDKPLFGLSDPMPGTEHVATMERGGTTSYYCRKHEKDIIPTMVAIGDAEPAPACDDCFYEQMEVLQADTHPPGKRVEVDFLCSDPDCRSKAEEECVKCHRLFCMLHYWMDARTCIDCLEVAATGYESEDEEPDQEDIKDPDMPA